MIKKVKNWYLRIKAILFAITLSTIPVLLTGTITYLLASENLTNYVIKYQESRAISTANEVSHLIFERYLDVKQLANLGILNDPRVSKTTSRKQALSIQDVVEAVNSLNLAAQETALGISQVKLGISQLNHAAKNLKSVV